VRRGEFSAKRLVEANGPTRKKLRFCPEIDRVPWRAEQRDDEALIVTTPDQVDADEAGSFECHSESAAASPGATGRWAATIRHGPALAGVRRERQRSHRRRSASPALAGRWNRPKLVPILEEGR